MILNSNALKENDTWVDEVASQKYVQIQSETLQG